MSPLILVSTEIRPADGWVWHAALDTYLKAVTGAGATPVLLPSLGDALDLPAVLSRVDGVLLTGSRSNVHPTHYGEEPSERHEPYDHDRDATTLKLIPMAIEMEVPLFAICRGFQELNVALGGTLVTEAQERPGSLDHRAPLGPPNDERFKLVHEVDFETDSKLAELLGARCIRVNSVHRQVIGKLSPRLIVEGRAPDGTIEAVRVRDTKAFAFGVQWHPEYWSATDPASGTLFRAFVESSRRPARSLPQAAE
jgi:putative glutamine amidotransferase